MAGGTYHMVTNERPNGDNNDGGGGKGGEDGADGDVLHRGRGAGGGC